MFRPNSMGILRSIESRDVHGRENWGVERSCAFAPVNLNVRTQKTTVRADSSASRGSADEKVSDRAKILVGKATSIKISDKFYFDGISYEVVSVHYRRSVTGRVDHIECGLALLP